MQLCYAAVQSSNIINIFDGFVVDGLIYFSVGTCQVKMLCDTEVQQYELDIRAPYRLTFKVNVEKFACALDRLCCLRETYNNLNNLEETSMSYIMLVLYANSYFRIQKKRIR